ncbi:MAG: glycerophosphodiester phosphodiesterase, partial [Halobacteriovoraceae bacterium]|nr:glycerophosphodiester phosphodiesterase [Halobacteriovoraceae bacterium]
HDEDCLRVWNSSLIISETNFSQLRQSIPEIPTLAEVVNLYGKKIHLFIELKEEHFPEVEKQKQILKDSLSSLDPIEDFHIIAVKPSPLQVFNLFDPACYLAVAISNPFEMSHLALTHNYGGLLGHYVLCDDAILAKHHAVKQKVGTGYCRTANCLKREVQRDVDWIMTNHPWILLNFIESFD